MDGLVYECQVCYPSLARAAKRVPPQFLECYGWFQDLEDEVIPRLPHRMATPPRLPLPLSHGSGIYVPSRSRVAYRHGRTYALSVHSSSPKLYADRDRIYLPDHTWIMDYAAQSGTSANTESQGYNRSLMNCLEDGIPIGVMVKERRGYRVLGLAYVERYNSATRMFTLHGPVNEATEAAHAFDLFKPGELEAARTEAPDGPEVADEAWDDGQPWDFADYRERRLVAQVRRKRQGDFRAKLMRAYHGQCAMTGADVPEALQAAHIDPYRGSNSQVASNGLLLRADMHLLFDARLLAVDPDENVIRVSARLAGTQYAVFGGERLARPDSPADCPSPGLLAINYEQFLRENEVLVG